MFIINTELIKEKMDNKNLTGAIMAEKLNITPGAFSILVNNKGQSINLEHAFKICKLLDLKIEDIIIDNKISHTSQDLLNEIYYLTEKLNKTTKQHIKKTADSDKPYDYSINVVAENSECYDNGLTLNKNTSIDYKNAEDQEEHTFFKTMCKHIDKYDLSESEKEDLIMQFIYGLENSNYFINRKANKERRKW